MDVVRNFRDTQYVMIPARIQELKNSVPKGDKKRKKELAAEIVRLEQELQKKHAEQLKNHENDSKAIESQDNQSKDALTNALASGIQLNSDDNAPKERGRVSKAQKRRDKKAAEASERDARIAEQEVENLQGKRHLEEVNLKALLQKRGLDIYQIPADGNCLYQAVVHQLSLNNDNRPEFSSVPELRLSAANQMRNDIDGFLPFLTNPQTGELLTSEEFETYCNDLATTNVWGGQIEIRALSEALKTPIEVVQASGPIITIGEQYLSEKKPLILSYHRHAFSLGEHYNSVAPKTVNGDVDESEAAFTS